MLTFVSFMRMKYIFCIDIWYLFAVDALEIRVKVNDLCVKVGKIIKLSNQREQASKIEIKCLK